MTTQVPGSPDSLTFCPASGAPDLLDLSVVVCHYGTEELLKPCLSTLEVALQPLRAECFVIDNASPGFSLSAWQAQFSWVNWSRNGSNLGFAAASNQGMRLARGRFVLLLNPDTLLRPDTLQRMLAFMQTDATIGAATCRLERPDGSLELACRRAFPTPATALWRFMGLARLFPHSRIFGSYNMTFLDENAVSEIDSPCGAFMMVRREILSAVGLLDERFWMYGEDLDWSLRIKRAGYRIMYNPETTVVHVKRAASSKYPQRSRRAFFESMRLFYRKHYAGRYPRVVAALVMFAIRLVELASARSPYRQ